MREARNEELGPEYKDDKRRSAAVLTLRPWAMVLFLAVVLFLYIAPSFVILISLMLAPILIALSGLNTAALKRSMTQKGFNAAISSRS